MTEQRGSGDVVSRSRAIVGALTTLVAATAIGVVAFALGSRRETHEYPFLVYASIPPALVVYAIARRARFLQRLDAVRWALAATAIGVLTGFAWTFAALFLTGGYLMAADFPVLYCWTLGSVLGLVIATNPGTKASTISAGGVVTSLVACVFALGIWLNRPSPVMRVYVRADATPSEVQKVWDEVLGDADPRGGQALLPGTQDIGTVSDPWPGTVLQVGFDRFASRQEIATVEARLHASPLIARYQWTRAPSR